ncbi:hypothetical protein QI141_02065 [Staphylococcus saprophyticus]|nr:hypothetical protein [Staphylococcus saprophyticus]MDW4237274.1 hypothetical protein [Staphylococcus saprophyticus]
MTNRIISFCNTTYENYYYLNEKDLPFAINQQAKIYCRYLLAYHLGNITVIFTTIEKL